MADDSTVLDSFSRAAACGALPLVHAESDPIAAHLVSRALTGGDLSWSRYPDVKPPAGESEAFSRITWFARSVSCPLYVVHTTVRGALDCARCARAWGQILPIETCPHYLVLDRSVYDDPGSGHLVVCSPPLREPGEVTALREGSLTEPSPRSGRMTARTHGRQRRRSLNGMLRVTWSRTSPVWSRVCRGSRPACPFSSPRG